MQGDLKGHQKSHSHGLEGNESRSSVNATASTKDVIPTVNLTDLMKEIKEEQVKIDKVDEKPFDANELALAREKRREIQAAIKKKLDDSRKELGYKLMPPMPMALQPCWQISCQSDAAKAKRKGTGGCAKSF